MISIISKASSLGHIESLDPNARVGYQIVGDLHQGLIDRYDHIKWLALTQEFGTFKPIQVLQASRAENRWTQWGKYMTEIEARRHWSREQMLSTFQPKGRRVAAQNYLSWQARLQHTARGRSARSVCVIVGSVDLAIVPLLTPNWFQTSKGVANHSSALTK